MSKPRRNIAGIHMVKQNLKWLSNREENLAMCITKDDAYLPDSHFITESHKVSGSPLLNQREPIFYQMRMKLKNIYIFLKEEREEEERRKESSAVRIRKNQTAGNISHFSNQEPRPWISRHLQALVNCKSLIRMAKTLDYRSLSIWVQTLHQNSCGLERQNFEVRREK